MPTFYLNRDDIRTDLHPRLWEDICDALGIEPDGDDYPGEIEVRAVRRPVTP